MSGDIVAGEHRVLRPSLAKPEGSYFGPCHRCFRCIISSIFYPLLSDVFAFQFVINLGEAIGRGA